MIATVARDQSREDLGKQEGMHDPPKISLPKGGGAIRGIGEKFAANPVTGTGSLTVPIFASPGRSGFDPEVTLSYDSGAGNGPFGLGWNLSLPSITRKTDKGLPQYRDAEESDIFMFAGAEDLVPVLVQDNGKWRRHSEPRSLEGSDYTVERYRPRIEGLFARIECWTETTTGAIHWRSISADNVTTWYGKTPESRIADPANPLRVFSWLICESHDDKGNVIVYGYMAEDSTGVDGDQPHEKNRTAQGRSANRYLKRIQYGNRTSRLDQPDPSAAEWLFEAVFDYGEHDPSAPMPEDTGAWQCRHDPFSTYRPGFEVRTYRLCQRVLMFHHFPEESEVGANCLVRSTDFTYRYEQTPGDPRNPVHSVLTSVTQSGYKRKPEGGYLTKSLPPVEFEYSAALLNDEIREVDPASLENLPNGVDGSAYQWVDLDGEGLSGVLTEQGGGWFYKRNESPLTRTVHQGAARCTARLSALETVTSLPAAGLAAGKRQLLDLAGDGRLDVVELDRPLAGFYERTEDHRWRSFRPFTSYPTLDWRDPNLKLIDLTGDGHPDVLITEDEVFTWYPSLAEAGFGASERVPLAWDEERGPRVVFADPAQTVFQADLSGDGLTDLVRIRNGEVCYWPNLGYGRFGAKVSMGAAPRFDAPDQFDPRRIRLADIDGSGVTDIIYLGRRKTRLWFNQSGNSWSVPRTLTGFPPVDNVAAVVAVDLFGNGTACLVWSSPLPGAGRAAMRYLNLMAEGKPHLLVRTWNNLGAETRVRYAPSTYFYLQDRQAGTPWVTRLPFPVHVVERVETYDHISRNRFVTRYTYHHGYFDGVEREFRGFGRVEQWDTEELAALSDSAEFPTGDNIDAASHVPPVLTKTWFHTGAYLGREHISDFFAGLLDGNDKGEYYREPGLQDPAARTLLLPDTLLPGELTVDEAREACRALKGSMLRQEVYALDGGDKQEHPYTVTEQNFALSLLQPHGPNRHAVFFSHANESIGYHYERNPADPRVSHVLTLEVDDFGNVLKSAAVGYSRRQPDADLSPEDQARQAQTLMTYTENRVTNAVDMKDEHRAPLPCETRTYELTGYAPTGKAGCFQMADFVSVDPTDPQGRKKIHAFDGEVAYEDQPTGGRQRRLIEHARTLYRRDNLAGPLPFGQLQAMALPYESYTLAFTPGLVAEVYGGRVTDTMLADEGRYVHSQGDANWWIPSGQVFYSPNSADTAHQELTYARAHFFLPCRYRDPFHTAAVSTESYVGYDAYDLLVTETRDALGNRVTVGGRLPNDAIDITKPDNDYRVLQPRIVTDPNRNRTEVAFDALGLVVGTAVMGKPPPAPVEGDLLDGFAADLTQAQVDGFYDAADPHTAAPDLLKKATTRIIYDFERFQKTRQVHPTDPTKWLPVYAATLARETHASDPLPADGLKIQISFSYSDGFGGEIQKKIQAEPGPVTDGGPIVSPRWVSSGWTIFNNKGKPVRQYEPFFSRLAEKRHRFEFGVQFGVSTVLFYDPVERVIATLHPNHGYEKVVFGPWRQETWDVNDTVLSDPRTDTDIKGYTAGYFASPPASPPASPWQTWHAQRATGALGLQEQTAAAKAAAHAETPTVAHFDTLGRPFLTVAHNKVVCANHALDGTEDKFVTRVELDIEGNQREVIDAKGRVVMRYDYDIAGPGEDEEEGANGIHQASMEAGERWALNDVAGNPIRAWDSRGFARRMSYDALRRPTGLYVAENGVERLAERTVYGENQGEAGNHRGRVYQVFDGAGIVTNVAYDFKGNLLENRRDFLPLAVAKQAVDWQQNPAANDGSFTSRTRYDALNRQSTVTSPDGSVYHAIFNEANLLDRVEVNLRGAAAATPFVTNIDYNAKGQRERIDYGNGATTRYAYDPLTFRLTQLKTTRPSNPDVTASQIFQNPTVVQDLRYTYDPVGNLTRIEDAALKTVLNNNQQIDPINRYTYDAFYRLIEAKGREHIGQTAFDFNPPNGNYRDYPFVGQRTHPNDLQALRNYVEQYEYDAVGNFEAWRHITSSGSWKRTYFYEEASLIEPGVKNNRLSRTRLGDGFNRTESYTHDAHGNMMSMPHLAQMVWDFEDQLQQVDLGGGGVAYYVYDVSGQRVRKVIERQNGTLEKERIYLGGFEVYREYKGNGTVTLERETLHVMDDQQRIALVETKSLDVNQPQPFNPQSLARYQIGNHLSSASVELAIDSTLISYEEYHPYGTTAFQAGRSATEVSLKRYRYTGKERDEETSLSYHEARYYAVWISRWISPDPKGITKDTNLYFYAQSSPIIYDDPNGTQTNKETDWKVDIRSRIFYWWRKARHDDMYARVKEPLSWRATLRALDSVAGAVSTTIMGILYAGGRGTIESVQNLIGMLPPQLDEAAIAAQSTGIPQGQMAAGGLRAVSFGARALAGSGRLIQGLTVASKLESHSHKLIRNISQLAKRGHNVVQHPSPKLTRGSLAQNKLWLGSKGVIESYIFENKFVTKRIIERIGKVLSKAGWKIRFNVNLEQLYGPKARNIGAAADRKYKEILFETPPEQTNLGTFFEEAQHAIDFARGITGSTKTVRGNELFHAAVFARIRENPLFRQFLSAEERNKLWMLSRFIWED